MKAKYDILRSFVPLVKHYHVTLDDGYKPITFTCQHFNGFVRSSGKSGEILCISFIVSGMSTLGIYPEELDPEISSFSGLEELKCKAYIRGF